MELKPSWALSALLGAFWTFLERSKRSFVIGLGQNGLQEAFGVDFVSILEGFWEPLGRIWEGFGILWEAICELMDKLEHLLDMLERLWFCWGRISKWTPALIRSASQFFECFYNDLVLHQASKHLGV